MTKHDLDLSVPNVPFDIFSLALEDPDLTYAMRCAEIWQDVCDEVLGEKFKARSHHNVGTYDAGCKGPLCRKAHREHPKRRSPSGILTQVREERIYDPVLEYFHTILKHRIRKQQSTLLKEIS
jgi:hypothetical protein